MPNYRIPSNADNDANGVWKMNDVKKAREGGEWPDPHVPASWTNYYIRRHTGDNTTITDGDQASTNANTQGTDTATMYLVAQNTFEAISFNLTQTGSHAGYKIRGAGIGGSNSYWSTSTSDAPTWMGKIYSGNGCVSANVIYDTGFVYPGYSQSGTDPWGDYFLSYNLGANHSCYAFLEYPDPATPYGGSAYMPTLSFGQTYTIAFAYRVSPGSYCYRPNYTGNYISGNSITLSDGNTITQYISTCNTYTDSNPYSAAGQTKSSYGIFKVMTYQFLV